MNTSQLKNYAPAARKAFIEAVTTQASRLGITAKGCEAGTVQGDVLLIGGQAFPIAISETREKLAKRVQAQGFEATMEVIAYTWFNRLIAIRFMELQGYLDHGYRVLSHPDGRALPEILDHAAVVDLPGLDREQAIALKLDGTKDEALYRLLLIAQCDALYGAMPFLFERIGDETELLLPEKLLQTDSLIRQLVESIDEAAWEQIEVIGWLYQFYISERKDQVIGTVVQSADIPAATQLFTPNWIVKYMVQNSLGAQWLATYPDSPLKEQMEFYITPAEQSLEVQAQLREITPSSLDPEALTLIDPACGSGHILVEAYDLFKAIYLERGYRLRDVPKLILEKNLFGLDICPRAAQLTGFALMMKGRADDRRLFDRQVGLNVRVFEDSTDFEPSVLVKGLNLADYGVQPFDLAEVKSLFENARVFGSLIQVSERLTKLLPGLRRLSEAVTQDLFVDYALRRLEPLVGVAEMLAAKYDVVVANPPYMGSKFHIPIIKKFTEKVFPDAKSDLFACFIERGFELVNKTGYNSMITMESWMFLSSYQKFRENIIQKYTIRNLAHFPYDGKRPTVMGINFGVAVISTQGFHIKNYKGHYCCSRYYELNDDGMPFLFPTPNERQKFIATDEFKKIPGTAVAYWVSDNVRSIFSSSDIFETQASPRQGLGTTNNDLFTRIWTEISFLRIAFGCLNKNEAKLSNAKWFPYSKGGGFRKWYGNDVDVVNWKNDGEDIRKALIGKNPNIPRSEKLYFREGITWGLITSAKFSARFSPQGGIFDVGGSKAFPEKKLLPFFVGLLNSKLTDLFLSTLNPTLNFQVGDLKRIPVKNQSDISSKCSSLIDSVIHTAKKDWDFYETSWDFPQLPLLFPNNKVETLEKSYQNTRQQWAEMTLEIQQLEEENNRIFIEAYGLQDELIPDVPLKEITLTCNPYYRYSKEATQPDKSLFPYDPDLETRLRQDTMQELVSYAVGCMMGRYSLDKPGLIYAHSENKDFDPSQYSTFPADDDGIIPLTDTEWFSDDAVNRLVEFMAIVWGAENLETNLTFLAQNLSQKKGESSREALRRYLCDSFFKDHLKTYKKRPIYWLFTSGKQKAFQCLVYLHRYNQATLSRMRGEYVIPLQGKLAACIENLVQDIQAATSTAHRKQLEKEQIKLQKQNAELLAFDEQLRHYTDLRISLDLDDGVKVNYSKFGDLLAEVKAICGKTEER